MAQSYSRSATFAAYELLQNTKDACIEQLRNDAYSNRCNSNAPWFRRSIRKTPKCTTATYRVALISYLRLTRRMKRMLTQTLQQRNSYLANCAQASRQLQSPDNDCRPVCSPADAFKTSDMPMCVRESRCEATVDPLLNYSCNAMKEQFSQCRQATCSADFSVMLRESHAELLAERRASTSDCTLSTFGSWSIDGALSDTLANAFAHLESCAEAEPDAKPASMISLTSTCSNAAEQLGPSYSQNDNLGRNFTGQRDFNGSHSCAQQVSSPTGAGSLSCVSDDSGICLSPLPVNAELPDAYNPTRRTTDTSESLNCVFTECASPDAALSLSTNSSQKDDSSTAVSPSSERSDTAPSIILPAGWRRCEDELGQAYFWHVPTGRTQREPPTRCNLRSTRNLLCKEAMVAAASVALDDVGNFCKNTVVQDICGNQEIPTRQKFQIENRPKHLGSLDLLQADAVHGDNRFSVLPIGSRVVEEDRLTSPDLHNWLLETLIQLERRAYVKCDQLTDVSAPCTLEFDSEAVVLRSKKDGSVVHSRQLRHVRLWATVEDFVVYVTFESQTRKQSLGQRKGESNYVCYAIRTTQQDKAICIADTFRKNCKSLKTTTACEAKSSTDPEKSRSERDDRRNSVMQNSSLVHSDSTDRMQIERLVEAQIAELEADEPIRAVACFFVGHCPASSERGVPALNEAIARVREATANEQYSAAYLLVTPSEFRLHRAVGRDSAASPHGSCTDTLASPNYLIDPRSTDSLTDGELIVRCPLRFLSFFAVAASDIRVCGLLLRRPDGPFSVSNSNRLPSRPSSHSAESSFDCYVIYCEPDAARLCQLLQAACTLRFQKALDAQCARKRYSDGNRRHFSDSCTNNQQSTSTSSSRGERDSGKTVPTSSNLPLSLQTLVSAFSAFKFFAHKS